MDIFLNFGIRKNSQPMKKVFFATLCSLLFSVATEAQIAVNSPVENVKIGGYIGTRIDDCIAQRVKAQDWEHLVEPFRNRTETWAWQSEFWGKWVQGAIASYRYNRDPELYEIIRQSAEAMMATQTPDGYIGNYRDDSHLKQWDVCRRALVCVPESWLEKAMNRMSLPSARTGSKISRYAPMGSSDVVGATPARMLSK